MRAFEIFDPLEEGTPVQYVGVYVLRWRSEWGEPAVGFAEIEDDQDDIATLMAEAYAEDQARQIIKLETENARLKEALESAGSWIAGAKVAVEPGWAGSTNDILHTISEALNHDTK
jgi:hypothetical protein